MAFNSDKKKKIKDRMDYGKGGRLSAVAQKAVSLNAPILIVGLGGTGAGAVLKIKRMVNERLECEKGEADIVKDKPHNIEYLVLDTDVSVEKMEEKGIGWNSGLEECQLFTTPNLQAIIQNPNLPDYMKSWIDPSISMEAVINGAGQFRQVGRIMMFVNINKIVNVLEAKLKRVTAGYDNTVPLYVFLVTGISGGTGSGTFLDMAYIIKAVAARVSIARVTQSIGMLFLPDVNLSRPNVGASDKDGMKVNGFAALKELDYLMNLNNNGEKFIQNYGVISVGQGNSNPGQPFEVCILMSTIDKNGVSLSSSEENDYQYKYTLNVAAETVLNFIAGEDAVATTEFSINSFLSNETKNRTIYRGNMGNLRRPVNYTYSIAGASSGILPINDIMSYMTYLAFSEVNDIYNKVPEESEVDAVMKYFGLDADQMEMDLMSELPVREEMDRHTHESIKANTAVVTADYQGTLKKQKEYIDKRIDDMAVKMQKSLTQDDNILNSIFKDVNKGPMMAQRVLYTSSDRPCVMSKLEKLNNYFVSNAPSTIQQKAYEEDMQAKLQLILTSRNPVGKNGRRNRFIEAADMYYDQQIKVYAYEKLHQLCQLYLEMFRQQNSRIYDSVADLLNTLVKLFEDYGKIKTEVTEEDRRDRNVKTMSWSMVNVPDFIYELEKRIMNTNDELYVDLKAFVRSFYGFLFKNKEMWINDKRTDVVDQLNFFISEAFSVVLDLSMDVYLDMFAANHGQSLEAYCEALFDTLKRSSNIMFPVSGQVIMGTPNPSYSFVSVPSNADKVKKVAVQCCGHDAIMKRSGIKESIFMMNFESAIPLFEYRELPDYHTVYEQHLSTLAGIHLYAKTRFSDKDWSELPSPYPESEWQPGHVSRIEAKRNHEIRDIFQKALDYDLIYWNEGSLQDTHPELRGKFVCKWGNPVNIDSILSKYNVTADTVEQINPAQGLKCLKELQMAMKDEKRFTQRRAVYDVVFNADGSPNMQYVKDIFIQMPEMHHVLKEMNENMDACMHICKKLEIFKKYAVVMEEYVLCQYTKVIYKEKGIFYYKDKNGLKRTFTSLTPEEGRYAQDSLFQKFFELDKDAKKAIVDMANKVKMKAREDDNANAQLANQLASYIAFLETEIDRIGDAYEEMENGEIIWTTYKNLLQTAKDIEKNDYADDDNGWS